MYKEVTNLVMNFKDDIFSFLCWFMLLYVVLTLAKTVQKNRKGSLRARISREFKHANREVFSIMDANERKEMMKVINTTVLNAELFKKNKVKTLEQSFPLKRKNRNSEKKVVFKLPVKGV